MCQCSTPDWWFRAGLTKSCSTELPRDEIDCGLRLLSCPEVDRGAVGRSLVIGVCLAGPGVSWCPNSLLLAACVVQNLAIVL